MKVWQQLEEVFLVETIRRAGLGNSTREPSCCRCLRRMVVNKGDADTGAGDNQHITDLFRCEMCGEFMECKDCCLERHQRSPLHNVEVRCIACMSMQVLIYPLALEWQFLGEDYATIFRIGISAGP